MVKKEKPSLTLGQAKRMILRLSADRLAARQTAKHAWDNASTIYQERDLLVYALSTVWPSHLMPHQNSRTPRWIVCIHSPQGQLAWHINEDELKRFAHLTRLPNHWDRCKTVDKHKRIAGLKPQWDASEIPTLAELATKRRRTTDAVKTSADLEQVSAE